MMNREQALAALKSCYECGGEASIGEAGRILCLNCGDVAQSAAEWNARPIASDLWHPDFVCDTNERVQAAVKLAQAVGAMDALSHAHIVAEDWNVEDGHIQYCIDSSAGNFFKLTPEQLAAERAYLEAMLALSFNERISVCAIEGELFSAEGVARFEQ